MLYLLLLWVVLLLLSLSSFVIVVFGVSIRPLVLGSACKAAIAKLVVLAMGGVTHHLSGPSQPYVPEVPAIIETGGTDCCVIVPVRLVCMHLTLLLKRR